MISITIYFVFAFLRKQYMINNARVILDGARVTATPCTKVRALVFQLILHHVDLAIGRLARVRGMISFDQRRNA